MRVRTHRPTASVGLTLLAILIATPSIRTGPSAQTVVAREAGTDSPAVIPFTIHVSDDVLQDLKQRLARARFPDELPDVNWNYGTHTAYLKGLVDYWRDTYDWRAQERMLNRFDQFTTTIDDVQIHFIHQRSRQRNAKPLLLLNGWPSSTVEYHKVIDLLTDPVAHGGRAEDSFHVVIPSMPGYGFSGKQPGRGYDTERIARMWMQLMARLGYSRYYVSGSDWGSLVAPFIALHDEAHLAGFHNAMCGGGAPPPAQGDVSLPPPPAVNQAVDGAHNLGYVEIQSTKPQTLGHALSDSPIGLASWIIEKWFGWSDHDGDMEEIFSKDDLLTNIMVYWVTNSGASSTRIYYETRHSNGKLGGFKAAPPHAFSKIPVGCANFPRQYDRRAAAPMVDSPELRAAMASRYAYFSILPRGGHFPALEQPTLWAEDLRTFIRAIQ